MSAVDDEAIALQAKLFRGLGDPSRLAILRALCAGPLTVGEIVQATRLSQPNTSNHLACLRACGLVSAEPQGRSVRYYLRDERVAALLSLAATLLTDVAQGIAACPRYNSQGGGDDGSAQAG